MRYGNMCLMLFGQILLIIKLSAIISANIA